MIVYKEILSECRKNKKNIYFYNISNKQEKFFLKNGFIKINNVVYFEI